MTILNSMFIGILMIFLKNGDPKYTYTHSESLWGKYTLKLVPRFYKD